MITVRPCATRRAQQLRDAPCVRCKDGSVCCASAARARRQCHVAVQRCSRDDGIRPQPRAESIQQAQWWFWYDQGVAMRVPGEPRRLNSVLMLPLELSVGSNKSHEQHAMTFCEQWSSYLSRQARSITRGLVWSLGDTDSSMSDPGVSQEHFILAPPMSDNILVQSRRHLALPSCTCVFHACTHCVPQ